MIIKVVNGYEISEMCGMYIAVNTAPKHDLWMFETEQEATEFCEKR
ncbi:MAG: hypothetical protein ACLVG9_00705 [Eubacteriales bacterium]|jgi:hypothetical protein